MSQQSDTTELNDNLDNLILILQPPEPASSVERRAADVLRRRIVATSDLPTPGIYLTNPYNPKKPFYVVGGLSGQPNQAASSLQTQVPPSASDDGSTTLAAPSNELDFQEQRLDSWEAPDGLSSVKKARPRASTKMPANRRQLAASFHSGTLLQVDGFQRLPGSERISERYYRTTIYVPMQDLPEGVESWQVVKGDRLSASFKVTVDTGSNTTWLFGFGSREVVDHQAVGAHISFDLKPWPTSQIHEHGVIPCHSELIVNGIEALKRADVQESIFLRRNQGAILYMDDSATLFELQPKPPTLCFLGQTYDFGRVRWQTRRPIQYRFCVAFGLNWEAMLDPGNDGVLALGLEDWQADLLPGSDRSPSMLQVIKDVVKNPSEEEGIALYVIIRSPRHTRQSCISFNIWPCLPTTVEPMWSNPIAVVMSGPRQETYPLWALRLEKMSFSVKFPPAPVEPSGVQRTEIQFGEGAGIIVYLDTGSSTSELPLDYINQIRRIFYHEGDLTGDSDDTVRTPYLVPNEVELDDSFVDLTFLSPGLERDEKVTVRCPLDPFICSLEPITENGAREGLIWITSDSGRQPNAALEGILGLNFFQAMFVALHKPAPSQDKRPYVRIATQWPNEIHSFVLPSIADNKV